MPRYRWHDVPRADGPDAGRILDADSIVTASPIPNAGPARSNPAPWKPGGPVIRKFEASPRLSSRPRPPPDRVRIVVTPEIRDDRPGSTATPSRSRMSPSGSERPLPPPRAGKRMAPHERPCRRTRRVPGDAPQGPARLTLRAAVTQRSDAQGSPRPDPTPLSLSMSQGHTVEVSRAECDQRLTRGSHPVGSVSRRGPGWARLLGGSEAILQLESRLQSSTSFPWPRIGFVCRIDGRLR